jgi:lysophospholipase L1-like esterase
MKDQPSKPPFSIALSIFSAFLALSLTAAPSVFGALNEGEDKTNGAVSENLAMKDVADVPGLPRVLLVGDSISIGYTLQVRQLLKDKANVHRIPINGGSSAVGRSGLKQWMGTEKWDIVHMNFGLHDAKYANQKNANTSLAAYDQNLQAMIDQIKATGAKIIWATTTPIPADLLPVTRRFDPIESYNEVAIQVMKRNGVPIDDLNAAISPRQKELQNPHDVHFRPEGCNLLGKAVAESILAQLPVKQAAASATPQISR